MQPPNRHIYFVGLNLLILLWLFNPAGMKNAHATKPLPLPVDFYIPLPDTGLPQGQIVHIPIVIESEHAGKQQKWKSAEITFQMDESNSIGSPADIKIETVKVNANPQAPQTVQVPLRATQDGLFELNGKIIFDFGPDGTSEKKTLEFRIGIFSFNKKLFIAASNTATAGSYAISKMARANLIETSEKYNELLKNNNQAPTIVGKYYDVNWLAQDIMAGKNPAEDWDKYKVSLTHRSQSPGELENTERTRLLKEFFDHNPSIRKGKGINYLWRPFFNTGS